MGLGTLSKDVGEGLAKGEVNDGSCGRTRMTTAVGIDLGTTYSAMAYVDERGSASMIPNA